MIKIRLHGTLDELKKAVVELEETFIVLAESEPYKDRGISEYYRIYVDCELKGK